MFAAISKDRKKDSKLDARAVRCIFIGFGVVENKKCVMAYTLNPSNPYKIGTVIDTVSYKSDPTYFPYRKGQERFLNLSGSTPSGRWHQPRRSKNILRIYLPMMSISGRMPSWAKLMLSLTAHQQASPRVAPFISVFRLAGV